MKSFLLLVIAVATVLSAGCTNDRAEPTSASGVKIASAKVPTGSDGLTVEQRNVKDRLEQDNKPGAIKHLYVISAYSGQVLIYSTVRGKVTSSGKRLTPEHLTGAGEYGGSYQDSHVGRTAEVLQDDGTYGTSVPYIYWWDAKGIYHQHYIEGGQILHISSEPIAVKGVVINMEVSGASSGSNQP